MIHSKLFYSLILTFGIFQFCPSISAQTQIQNDIIQALKPIYPGIELLQQPPQPSDPLDLSLQTVRLKSKSVAVSEALLTELVFEAAWQGRLGSTQALPRLKDILEKLNEPRSAKLLNDLTSQLSFSELLKARNLGNVWETSVTMLQQCQTERWQACYDSATQLTRHSEQVSSKGSLAEAYFYQGLSQWRLGKESKTIFKFWAQCQALAQKQGNTRLELRLQAYIAAFIGSQTLMFKTYTEAEKLEDNWLQAEFIWLEIYSFQKNIRLSDLNNLLLNKALTLSNRYLEMEARFNGIKQSEQPPENDNYFQYMWSLNLDSNFNDLLKYYEHLNFPARLMILYRLQALSIIQKSRSAAEILLLRSQDQSKSVSVLDQAIAKTYLGYFYLNHDTQKSLAYFQQARTLYRTQPKSEQASIYLNPLNEAIDTLLLNQAIKTAKKLENADNLKAALDIYWKLYRESSYANLQNNTKILIQKDPQKFADYLIEELPQNQKTNEYYQILSLIRTYPHPAFEKFCLKVIQLKSSYYNEAFKTLFVINPALAIEKGIQWLESFPDDPKTDNLYRVSRLKDLYHNVSRIKAYCQLQFENPKSTVRYFCLNFLENKLETQALLPFLSDPDIRIRNEFLRILMDHPLPGMIQQSIQFYLGGKRFEERTLERLIEKFAKPEDMQALESYLQDRQQNGGSVLPILARLDSDKGLKRYLAVLDRALNNETQIDESTKNSNPFSLEKVAIRGLEAFPLEHTQAHLSRALLSNRDFSQTAAEVLVNKQDPQMQAYLIKTLEQAQDYRKQYWAFTKLEFRLKPDDYWELSFKTLKRQNNLQFDAWQNHLEYFAETFSRQGL